MIVQLDTTTQEMFVKHPDGSTLEVSKWDKEGTYGHLKDGEREVAHDGGTASHVGEYVFVAAPPNPWWRRATKAMKARSVGIRWDAW